MGLSKKPYKGCRDFFPEEMRQRQAIFQKMSHVAEMFGYGPYEGPILEEVELYKAKSGEELVNQQIYSFVDRGGRNVAIRPEMTPTLARMVAQIYKEEPMPLRLYSIPNLMRYERPQKGRLREHWQLNCDVFGAPGFLGELEIFQLLIKLFNSFGANESHFEIKINDREIVDCLFSSVLKVDEEKSYKLIKLIDRSKKISGEELLKSAEEILGKNESLNQFLNYLKVEDFSDLKKFVKDHGVEASASDLLGVLESLKELEIEKYFVFDSNIVRGLDYYTGIVFEVFDKHPDNRRALCGGGSYKNLLKIFGGDSVKGVGVGMGDVTFKDFLNVHNLLDGIGHVYHDLYIAYLGDESQAMAFQVGAIVRAKDFKVIINRAPKNLKKSVNLALKNGAKWLAVIGSEEVEKNIIRLKNLETKEEFTPSPKELLGYFS
jgi:histidyl-tRNA synthetase